MASVTVTLPDAEFENQNNSRIRYRIAGTARPSLANQISADGAEIWLALFALRYAGTPLGRMNVVLAQPQSERDLDPHDDFSDQMEQNGTITMVASDGVSLAVTGISDSTEPYDWIPTNITEVVAFANHLRGLAAGRRSLTITFDDNAPPDNSAPEVTGISADHDPISGGAVVTLTPTVTDAEDALGTLTYEWSANGGTFADPSAQNAMWTAPAAQADARTYTATLTVTDPGGLSDTGLILLIVLAAPRVIPSFADNTGDAQDWTQDTAIAPVTVQEANGNPAPTYAAVGALPAGISFNPTSRVISGTPTEAGTGTVRIRATNTAGVADWTMAYTTTAVVIPVTPGVLGLRYGGVTLGHLRYGGTNFASARYGGVSFGGGMVTPPVTMSLWERLVAHDGGSGNIIDVTLDDPIAGGNATQHFVYEHTPSYGTLNQAHPAGMFTDPSLYWNERPRFNHNGGGNDEYIVALHRGGSNVSQTVLLGGLSDQWAWYVINADTEEWVSWQANVINASGGAWLVYKAQNQLITNGIEGIRSYDPVNVTSGHDAFQWTFEGVTAGSRMLMALINSDTFEPYP